MRKQKNARRLAQKAVSTIDESVEDIIEFKQEEGVGLTEQAARHV